MTVTVTRIGGAGGPVSVGYATGGGTATAGTDYLATTGTLTWANGETGTKSFTVTIQDDALLEGPETIGLTLSNPTGGAALGNQAAAEVQLADFEQGVLAFESLVVAVDEDAQTDTIEIWVTRTSGTDGKVTVRYGTADGTARTDGGPENGQADYTPILSSNPLNTLSWDDGEGGRASQPIRLTIGDGQLQRGPGDDHSRTVRPDRRGRGRAGRGGGHPPQRPAAGRPIPRR